MDPRQLLVAAENGRIEEIKVLLEAGADVNAKDIGGWSALQWASAMGHVETARLLLDHGANVNTTTNLGWTPLHYASNGGSVTMACMLLGKGANMFAPDNEGKTPMDVANNEHTDKALLSLQEKWTKTFAVNSNNNINNSSSNNKASSASASTGQEKKEVDNTASEESTDDGDAHATAATAEMGTTRIDDPIIRSEATHKATPQQMSDLDRKSISTAITNLQAFVEQQNKQAKVAQIKMTNLIQEQTERQFQEIKILQQENKNINAKVEQLLLAQQQQQQQHVEESAANVMDKKSSHNQHSHSNSSYSSSSNNDNGSSKMEEVLKSLQNMILEQTKTIQALEKKLTAAESNLVQNNNNNNKTGDAATTITAPSQETLPMTAVDAAKEQRSSNTSKQQLLLEKLESLLQAQEKNGKNSTNSSNTSSETPVLTGSMIHAKLERLLGQQDRLLMCFQGKAGMGMEFLQVSLARCRQVGQEQQLQKTLANKKTEIDYLLQAHVRQLEEEKEERLVIAENAAAQDNNNCQQEHTSVSSSLQHQVETGNKQLAAPPLCKGGAGSARVRLEIIRRPTLAAVLLLSLLFMYYSRIRPTLWPLQSGVIREYCYMNNEKGASGNGSSGTVRDITATKPSIIKTSSLAGRWKASKA